MTPTHRVGAVAGAAVLAMTASGFAGERDEKANDELMARIAELEAQVSTLRAEQSGDWLTQQRADEIRAVVEDVLADSETRASLLQGGGTAGWDDGFFLASPDGNFRLNVGGQIQARWALSYRDDMIDFGGGGVPVTETTQNGFEMRRVKLVFDGHVVDPSIRYKVQTNFGSGVGVLEDAYIAKDYGNGWSAAVGQMKGPLLREELVSSAHQQAVERSLLNEVVTLDRVQGLSVTYTGDNVRFTGMYHDGRRSANTMVIGGDSPTTFGGETEFSLAGRVDILFSGNFSQFKDFASWNGEEAGFLLGAAANFDKGASGTPGGPEEERFSWTVDGSYEGGGWNVFAAIVGDHFDEADVDLFGFVVQGGIFVTDDIDLFGRYEWMDGDDTRPDDLSVITVGVNKYFDKHSLKWTTDVSYGFDNTVGWASSGANFAGGDDELVIRSQLQLLF